jgi:hypothetical protein
MAASDPVNAAQRTFLILKHVNKTPSLAACSKCQRKFFTPSSYFNDRSGAEYYLKQKFDLHRCEQETRLQFVRRW